MKKPFMKTKFTCLLIILIFLFSLTGFSKSKTGQEEFRHEFGLFFNHDRETFRLHFDNNRTTPVEIIGWSENGLFACRYRSFQANIFREYPEGLRTPPIEYISEFPARFTFVIINTNTNEIIEEDSIGIGEGVIGIVEENSIHYLYDENEKPYLIGNIANLNEVLESYKNKWEALLQKHKIIGRVGDLLANNFKTDLLDFPIGNYSCWYDYVIKYDIFKDILSFDRTDTIKWKLKIGNDFVQKIISKNDVTVWTYNIIGSKILGYYKSPYDNSIIVVTNYYRYTSYPESDSLWGTLNFYACNLGDIK